MSEEISCFRCGASLEYLSLPLSRRDECRACRASVHVCRMCVFFDKAVPKQCAEDDAEEVIDKEKVNFCEWFKPASGLFDSVGATKAARARSELDGLFGTAAPTDSSDDPDLAAADDLFK